MPRVRGMETGSTIWESRKIHVYVTVKGKSPRIPQLFGQSRIALGMWVAV